MAVVGDDATRRRVGGIVLEARDERSEGEARERIEAPAALWEAGLSAGEAERKESDRECVILGPREEVHHWSLIRRSTEPCRSWQLRGASR